MSFDARHFFLRGVLMEDYVTRSEYQHEITSLQGEISNLYSKVNSVDRRITASETLISTWKDLPGTIASLDKTLTLVQQNLESLNEKLDRHIQDAESKDVAQDAKLKQMDENSKIDIVKTIRDNWWKLCMAVAAVAYFLEPYIKSTTSQ